MTDHRPDAAADPFGVPLAANREYAGRFSLQGLAAPAARGLCVVTCMDSRIEPLLALGLVPGDAKILRNAGGRVTGDVLRSLVLATRYLNVSGVAVMHHTDCAMTNLDEAGIRADLTPAQRAATDGWDFLTMADPDAALAADVEAVRACRGLADGVRVAGWRYDVATGAIRQLVEP